mmetsp:Transcript_121180/g.270882  ORF Transcript_121180/g.270882 Transcript_121180/m.270882 type:complete len:447 (-) Transcript_121180:1089-2429(-)
MQRPAVSVPPSDGGTHRRFGRFTVSPQHAEAENTAASLAAAAAVVDVPGGLDQRQPSGSGATIAADGGGAVEEAAEREQRAAAAAAAVSAEPPPAAAGTAVDQPEQATKLQSLHQLQAILDTQHTLFTKTWEDMKEQVYRALLQKDSSHPPQQASRPTTPTSTHSASSSRTPPIMGERPASGGGSGGGGSGGGSGGGGCGGACGGLGCGAAGRGGNGSVCATASTWRRRGGGSGCCERRTTSPPLQATLCNRLAMAKSSLQAASNNSSGSACAGAGGGSGGGATSSVWLLPSPALSPPSSTPSQGLRVRRFDAETTMDVFARGGGPHSPPMSAASRRSLKPRNSPNNRQPASVMEPCMDDFIACSLSATLLAIRRLHSAKSYWRPKERVSPLVPRNLKIPSRNSLLETRPLPSSSRTTKSCAGSTGRPTHMEWSRGRDFLERNNSR